MTRKCSRITAAVLVLLVHNVWSVTAAESQEKIALVVSGVQNWLNSLSFAIVEGNVTRRSGPITRLTPEVIEKEAAEYKARLIASGTQPERVAKEVKRETERMKRDATQVEVVNETFTAKILDDDRYCLQLRATNGCADYISWTDHTEQFLTVTNAYSAVHIVNDKSTYDNVITYRSPFRFRDDLREWLKEMTFTDVKTKNDGRTVDLVDGKDFHIEIDRESFIVTKVGFQSPEGLDFWGYELSDFRRVGGMLYPYSIRDYAKKPDGTSTWDRKYVFEKVSKASGLSPKDLIFPKPLHAVYQYTLLEHTVTGHYPRDLMQIEHLVKPDPSGTVDLEKELTRRGVRCNAAKKYLPVTDLKDVPEHYLPSLAHPWCIMELSNITNDVLPQIKDIPVTHLILDQSKVVDLNSVRGMPLVELSMRTTKICDLSPLKAMKLYTVDIRESGVTDISPLEGMPLNLLDLTFTKVSNITPVERIPSLEALFLSDSAVTDITVIAKTQLKQLYLPETVTTGLDLLRRNKTITHLAYKDSDFMPVDEFWKKVDSGEIKIKK